MTNKKTLVIGGGLAAVGVILYLAVAVFGVQTLFIDDEVDEANPFAETSEPTSQAATTVEELSEEPPAAPATDAEADAAPADTGSDSSPAEPVDSPALTTLAMGDFFDADHPTSGVATVITDGSQTRFLRFENFETDNGPDLNVWLRSSANPDDYIDLGDLKGNIGDQNYELSSDIDLSIYDTVDVWCVRFGVSFGGAVLSP